MKFKFKKYWRKTSLKNVEDGKFLLEHIFLLKPKKFFRNWCISWGYIKKCM